MPGFIGFPEILLLGLVVLVLFGPKRLPEMGRSLGKGFREFKDSITGDNKEDQGHGFDVAQLEITDGMTVEPLAPAIPLPVADLTRPSTVLAPREVA